MPRFCPERIFVLIWPPELGPIMNAPDYSTGLRSCHCSIARKGKADEVAQNHPEAERKPVNPVDPV
jgi:hypothetical protein